jgi:hypothetical protein
MNRNKKIYLKPTVDTLSSRQIIEALGVVHASTYQAEEMLGYGE